MNKLSGIKVSAVGTITFLSLWVLSASSAVSQEKQKPVAQTQNPAPAQPEQMSGCGCCKKMMEQKTNDSQNKMPGMNHSAPSGK